MFEGNGRPSRSRLAQIKMVVFDFDGILTDNYVWVSESGERSKRFWVPDGVGVFMAHKAGLKFAIITGNDDPSTRHRAEYLRIDDVYQNVRNKGEVYDQLKTKHDLSDAEILYLGDDLPDQPVFIRECLTLAPPDAHEDIKKLAKWVGRTPGGCGIVREAIDALLDARGFEWSPQASRQSVEAEKQ